MLVLDLFAGLGGASQAFRDRGHGVMTVDVDPAFGCTVTADLTTWTHPGPRPDLVWASPPCVEFSRTLMPWFKDAPAPGMALATAAVRIIAECGPRWWVVENVRGAVKWFRPILGEPKVSCGPFFLWGRFPDIGRVRFRGRRKESYSSTKRAERAKVPYELSLALCRACESVLF